MTTGKFDAINTNNTIQTTNRLCDYKDLFLIFKSWKISAYITVLTLENDSYLNNILTIYFNILQFMLLKKL